MDKRIIELALEALQKRKRALDAEIEQLSAELKGGIKALLGKRSTRTAAERRAHSRAMQLYWQRKRAAAQTSTEAKPRSGPQSSAARKAVSERMKAYWSKRKAQTAKAPVSKKATSAKGPQSAAARKALSEKMRQIWAKRKAEAAKKVAKQTKPGRPKSKQMAKAESTRAQNP